MPTTALANAKSRQEWAAIINADWRKSIESILRTAHNLVAAKEELPHGEFGRMLQEDLDFGPKMAEMLMKIAKHPIIGKATTSSDLPARWAVLSELVKLPAEDFKWAQERGLISPDTTARSARTLVQAMKPGDKSEPVNTGHMLPTPTEARNIARETERPVVASDGRVYTGITREEKEEYQKHSVEAYRVIDAIKMMAGLPDAATWFDDQEYWRKQPHNFDADMIREAGEWLLALADVVEEHDDE